MENSASEKFELRFNSNSFTANLDDFHGEKVFLILSYGLSCQPFLYLLKRRDTAPILR